MLKEILKYKITHYYLVFLLNLKTYDPKRIFIQSQMEYKYVVNFHFIYRHN